MCVYVVLAKMSVLFSCNELFRFYDALCDEVKTAKEVPLTETEVCKTMLCERNLPSFYCLIRVKS